MIVSVSTKNEFIPEWNDNKDSEEPIVVHYKAPTMVLVNSLLPKPTIDWNVGSNMAITGGAMKSVIDNSKIVRQMVTKIKNLSVSVDDKVIKIETGEDLFGKDAPSILAGLVDEIGSYLQGVLSERVVDQKN